MIKTTKELESELNYALNKLKELEIANAHLRNANQYYEEALTNARSAIDSQSTKEVNLNWQISELKNQLRDSVESIARALGQPPGTMLVELARIVLAREAETRSLAMRVDALRTELQVSDGKQLKSSGPIYDLLCEINRELGLPRTTTAAETLEAVKRQARDVQGVRAALERANGRITELASEAAILRVRVVELEKMRRPAALSEERLEALKSIDRALGLPFGCSCSVTVKAVQDLVEHAKELEARKSVTTDARQAWEALYQINVATGLAARTTCAETVAAVKALAAPCAQDGGLSLGAYQDALIEVGGILDSRVGSLVTTGAIEAAKRMKSRFERLQKAMAALTDSENFYRKQARDTQSRCESLAARTVGSEEKLKETLRLLTPVVDELEQLGDIFFGRLVKRMREIINQARGES